MIWVCGEVWEAACGKCVLCGSVYGEGVEGRWSGYVCGDDVHLLTGNVFEL